MNNKIFSYLKSFFLKSSSLFFFVLLAYAQYYLFYRHGTHAEEWPAQSDVIIATKLYFSNLLNNDFTTADIYNSPTIFYGYIIYLLGLIFHIENNGIILIGFLSQVLYISILYLLTKKAVTSLVGNSIKKYNIFVDIVICLALVLSSRFFNKPLMGWPPFFFNPHGYSISFLITIIAFLFWDSKLKKTAITFQVIACLIHPAMSLFCLCFLSIISFCLYDLKKILPLMFTEIVIILVILLIFKQASISSADFFRIYVLERHPHHHLISQSLDRILFIKLFILYLFTAFISFRLNVRLFCGVITSFFIFFSIPFVQYYAVEKLHNQLIMSLGITRFFHFSILFLIIFNLINAFLIQEKILSCPILKKYYNYALSNIRYYQKFKDWIYLQKYVVNTIIFFISIVSLLLLYSHYVIHEYKFYSEKKSEFISTYYEFTNIISSPDTDVVYVLDRNPCDFIVYGKINNYFTNVFPFDRGRFFEFSERKKIANEFNQNRNAQNLSKLKKYKIDYILLNKGNYSEDLKSFLILESTSYDVLKL